jgi:electron transfer flavoprotein alpha subunit
VTAAGILVWSERPALARELLGEARRLADDAGCEIGVCVGGAAGADEVAAYGGHGADVVYLTGQSERDPAGWAGALDAVIVGARPRLVLIGGTKTGMEVAPRVAERRRAAYAAWAVEIGIDPASGATTANCMLYGGTGLATYRFLLPLTVLTAAPGTFEARELGGRTARAEPVVVADETPQLTVIGEHAKPAGGARLQEAKAIVDIGQGVKELEDLETARSLAGLLDGQLSCSRPVASGRDWLPEWLGLSGAKVKPELCLTIGISGAIQHVVGIRESRVIAAVNNDETAAIFTQADVGVVADLHEFLPVLIERLQARGARPAWRSETCHRAAVD